jgi:hypothetical protein
MRTDALCCKVACTRDNAFSGDLPSLHAGRNVGARDKHVCFKDDVFADQGDVVKVGYTKFIGEYPDDLFFS